MAELFKISDREREAIANPPWEMCAYEAWLDFIPEQMRDLWSTLSDAERIAAYVVAKRAAAFSKHFERD